MDRILKIQDVCEMVGLSRASIYAKIALETFPKQVKLTSKSVGWKLSDIQKYIASL